MLNMINVQIKIWRILDPFPTNIYGYDLRYSSKKIIIEHLCNLIPSLRQVMSKLYVYFKSKNERAMRRLNYSLFSLKKSLSKPHSIREEVKFPFKVSPKRDLFRNLLKLQNNVFSGQLSSTAFYAKLILKYFLWYWRFWNHRSAV